MFIMKLCCLSFSLTCLKNNKNVGQNVNIRNPARVTTIPTLTATAPPSVVLTIETSHQNTMRRQVSQELSKDNPPSYEDAVRAVGV